MECVLDESGADEEQCRFKVSSGRRVTGDIRPLVKAKNLQLECARVLHEPLVVPVLTYGSKTMTWRKNERSRIWVV